MSALFRWSQVLLLLILWSLAVHAEPIDKAPAFPAVGSTEHPFHDLAFGMTEDEVTSAMPEKPYVPDEVQGDLWRDATADLTYRREEFGFTCHVECWFEDDKLAKVVLHYNTEVVQSKIDGKSEGLIGEQLKLLYGDFTSRNRDLGGTQTTEWTTDTSTIALRYTDAGSATDVRRMIAVTYLPIQTEPTRVPALPSTNH